MIEDFDWSFHLNACFESTEYCCLATQTNGGVWANPVYFSYDDEVNLFFISQPHSLHMRNIEDHNEISVAIYDTSQSTHGDVCGTQIRARAVVLDSIDLVEYAYDIYYGRVFSDSRKHPEKSPDSYVGNTAEWLFVKVFPLEIWYFDTRFFGEERTLVPEGTRVTGI